VVGVVTPPPLAVVLVWSLQQLVLRVTLHLGLKVSCGVQIGGSRPLAVLPVWSVLQQLVLSVALHLGLKVSAAVQIGAAAGGGGASQRFEVQQQL
jgi:hypothetical protein